MSRDQTLLNKRLTAEHEGELCVSREENLRRQQLFAAPRIVLVRGNVDYPPIKDEPEEQSIRPEEEPLPFPEEGRKRKRKFDPEELKVLVAGVKAHYHELHKKNVTITRRNSIWQQITNRVNAVGHKDRTPSEIKRRWQDARRRTKEKVANNNASVSDVGGGSSEYIPLDTIEEQVLLTFCDEQVNGIPGIDTLISDQDYCENPPCNSTAASASSACLPATPPSPQQQEAQDSDTRAPPYLDFDNAVLSEMKAQHRSIRNGLSVLAENIRSISKVARVLREDTRAISKNSRDLVGAVTDLTAAVQELTKAVSERRPPKQELENRESDVHATQKDTKEKT